MQVVVYYWDAFTVLFLFHHIKWHDGLMPGFSMAGFDSITLPISSNSISTPLRLRRTERCFKDLHSILIEVKALAYSSLSFNVVRTIDRDGAA